MVVAGRPTVDASDKIRSYVMKVRGNFRNQSIVEIEQESPKEFKISMKIKGDKNITMVFQKDLLKSIQRVLD
jgi:hypothetical protein